MDPFLSTAICYLCVRIRVFW